MSYVNVLITKDDCVYFLNAPYRTILALLDGDPEVLLAKLNSRFLDAGYMVLDLNKKVIVNGQSAFPPSRILTKKYFVIDV